MKINKRALESTTKTKIMALFVAVVGTAFYFFDVFSPADNWETHHQAGLEAYRNGLYSEAEKEFAAALKKAEEILPSDQRLHVSLNQLVEVYQIQSKYIEAEPLIKRMLAIDEKNLGSEHPNVAANLNNLARNYRLLGKYEEAEPLIKRALEILVKSLGPEHSLAGNVREHYANLLREMGRNVEAEELETEFKTIAKKQATEN